MKKVFRKDMKDMVPAFAMMASAFVVLEIQLLLGVALNNKGMVNTALYMAVFAMVVTIAWILYAAGGVFLRNLRERMYFTQLEKEGVSVTKTVVYKILYNTFAIAVFAGAYAGAFFVDLKLLASRFPEEKEGIEQFGIRKMIQGESGDPLVPAVLTTILEYLTAGFFLVVLVYLAVVITYAFCYRSKLCAILCVVAYLLLFMMFYKVSQTILAGLSGIEMHLAASALNFGTAFVLGIAAIWLLVKRTLPLTAPKQY